MTLRTRLLLALGGSGLAILLGGFVAREVAFRYASEASIQSSLDARLGTLDRETCEAGMDLMRREFRPRADGERPAFGPRPDEVEPRMRPRPGNGFGGPPPEGLRERGGPFGGPRMTRVFFYDSKFNPRPPGGPPFPESAKARLRRGEASAHGREEGGFFGAAATPWPGGVCSYALAILPTPPPLAAFTTLIMGALLLIGAPAIALWFALTKPVARLRALAADVRTAASRHYETSVPVQGRDEIAELGHAFNEASAVVRAHVAEVERREKALRDFVAHTTHDVALPLSVLLSHVATLRQNADPGGSEATIAAIGQETQYISSLLANLEAVARLESDTALHEKHPVDLTALVERVAVRHRGVASGGGIDFNHAAPAAPVWVRGDVTLIEQAVNNLVHNAIQYNRPGGHVALVLERAAEDFVIRVSDDGPGVRDHDMPHLGETRFRSEEARSRRPNGMGLGLSIARDVARRHGFALTLGNRTEGGFEAVLTGALSSPEVGKTPSA